MNTMSRKRHPKNWIKHYRKEEGLTSEQLAEKIGMSAVGLRYIENGERGLSIEKAKQIGDALGKSYIDIIEGPAENIMPQTEAQKDMLRAIQKLKDQDQDIYIAGFLSGLKPRKEEEEEDKPDETNKNKKTGA